MPRRSAALSVTIAVDMRVPVFFASLWQPQLICACSVFRLRRARAAACREMLSVARDGRGIAAVKDWLPLSALHRSLFLSPPKVIFILQRPMPYGPGGSRPPVERETSSRPPPTPTPALGDRRCPMWCETGQVQWTFTLAGPGWVHPDDVHFSLDHCPSPPHPTSHALNGTNG